MRYILIFFFALLICVNVYGEEDIVDRLDMDAVEKAVDENTELSFKELIKAVVSGEDISDIIKKDISGIVKKQLSQSRGSIRNIIVLGIICGLINILAQDINDRSVAELINLTGQIIILGIASVSLKNSVGLLQDCIESITDIINSAIPLIMTITVLSGRGVSAGGAILAMGTETVAKGIDAVVIPLLIMGAVLKIVNIISEREILDRLSELFIGATSWALKICAYAFVFIMGLERISGGAVGRSAGSVLKSAVKMIPVVGDIVGGAGDIAVTAILAVGNAVGIVLIIVIIIISSIPLIEIGITAFVYKLAAAVLEPVCDKTTIAVIDTIGEANFKVLAALFIVNAMFVMSLAVLMCSVR